MIVKIKRLVAGNVPSAAVSAAALGMDDVASRVRYQVPVPVNGTTKFLDAWIPETRVLVEHKSRGVDLDAPQADHGGLTSLEHAAECDSARAKYPGATLAQMYGEKMYLFPELVAHLFRLYAEKTDG